MLAVAFWCRCRSASSHNTPLILCALPAFLDWMYMRDVDDKVPLQRHAGSSSKVVPMTAQQCTELRAATTASRQADACAPNVTATTTTKTRVVDVAARRAQFVNAADASSMSLILDGNDRTGNVSDDADSPSARQSTGRL